MTEGAKLRYEIRSLRPSDHRVEVVLTVAGVGDGPLELVVPSWVPGSYWMQDRARNLSDVRANAAGATSPLGVRRVAKDRWRVDPDHHDAVEVRYSVYGNELRAALLDVNPDHLYVSPGFVLPLVDGRRDEPHDVSLVVPPDWTIHTELPEVGRHPPTFRARDFDELVDSPIDAGHPETFTIHPAGVPHHMVLCGDGGNYETHRLQQDVGQIVEAVVRLFGESPVPSYTFFYHLAEQPPHGLEHARSNSCVFSPTTFRPESAYRHFLRVTSHEYLHLYNVKRIRPKAFDRVDYSKEAYTRLLWAMEGTTDYLSLLILRRAGRIGAARYLSTVADEIRGYRERPGRRHQSLEDASVAAWVDFYKPFEDTPNRSISYYLKGNLVSLCLDLHLRAATDGRKSLETAWADLWRSHGRSLRGLEEDELERVLSESTGVDLARFFDDYVRGTAEVDFERHLALVGLELAPPTKRPKPDDDAEPGSLGVDVETSGGLARITTVRDGGAGRQAGLSPGDEILAFDGGRVTFERLPKALARSPAGTRVEVTVFRRGRLLTLPVVLGEAPPKELVIASAKQSTEGARKLYESWLGESWSPPGAGDAASR